MPQDITPLASAAVRHRRPWKDTSRGLKVPLWTSTAAGQLLEGKIVVPRRLARATEHTNERHEFDRLVRENVLRWAAWRAKRGWHMATKPTVRGPYTPPTAGHDHAKKHVARAEAVLGKPSGVNPLTVFDGEDVVWYFATARFRRETPVYIGLDDMLEIKDVHDSHGISMDADPLPVSQEAEDGAAAVGFTDGDSGWVNPMEFAEKRRQALGLKREDYLMGPLCEPL